ncbi:hypothetical protein AB0E59_42500 [Lentzea sp. NPDC034063]|uniref:hypothetical protein n=1 Tax=unclassified Lentzea TaxID=2643253 RepID=UPI00340FC0F7
MAVADLALSGEQTDLLDQAALPEVVCTAWSRTLPDHPAAARRWTPATGSRGVRMVLCATTFRPVTALGDVLYAEGAST